MAGSPAPNTFPIPTIFPFGDSGIVVRFGTALSDEANKAVIALARALDREAISGVVEVVPNLVSVLLRYDPRKSSPDTIAGELRLRMQAVATEPPLIAKRWTIPTRFDGPDLNEVVVSLGLDRADFVTAHNQSSLRVLATGFAPGFVYCGLHPEAFAIPRRSGVRPSVPAGSVLFAAGQTAIAATAMPTGWHVIGYTDFANFNPGCQPPTRLAAGDDVVFEVVP